MLLVIMTRSLIRLGNTVRTSLNNDCMTNSHDERQWDRTRVNNYDNYNTIKSRDDNDEYDRDRTRVENCDDNEYN